MAVTLLEVVQRVSRHVGLDPTITAFSNDDETNDLVQYINEAYEDLKRALYESVPYFHGSTSFTTSNGTRLYNIPTAEAYGVFEWSFENETENDSPLEFATREWVKRTDARFDEATGKPSHVYLEGSQFGLWPIPDGTYTIKFDYSSKVTRLSATSDTFVVPDDWVRYIEKKAEAVYKGLKGFNDAQETLFLADNLLTEIIAEAWTLDPTYLL